MKQFWKKTLWATFLTAAFTLTAAGCGEQENSSDISDANSAVQEQAEDNNTPIEESVSETNVYRYQMNEDGTISITGYSGNDTALNIPATVDSYVVSGIADHAFEANWDILSVTLPNGLTTIGESAFMDCSSLTTVSIPETVSEVRRAAFAGCTSLSSITLPESTLIVQEEVFTGCSSLSELTIWNTTLEYDRWGLIENGEPLNVMIFCPSGSTIGTWAQENGIALQEIN